MINEEDLYPLLGNRLPGLQAEINNMGDSACPYKLAAFFAVYTKRLIAARNYREVKKCFSEAEELFRNGCPTIKDAMENVYIFSVSNTIGRGHKLYEEFSSLLKEGYKQQVDVVRT